MPVSVSESDRTSSIDNGYGSGHATDEPPLLEPNLSAATPTTASVLVVTHTRQGKILSLHWPQTTDCQACEDLSGQSVEELFGPVAIESYLARVEQVLATQKPEEFRCVVRCGHQPISFEFLLSPLPVSDLLDETSESPKSVQGSVHGMSSGNTGVVVGIGRRIVPEVAQLADVKLPGRKGATGNSYYALLSNVASNIRRTLNLNTIWQQTVSGLGDMLDLDRCLVCDYSKAMQTLKVVAEYHQPNLHPCLGKTFDLALKSDFLDTLKSLEPVISDFERGDENGENDQPYTVLTVATCYQNEPNSILVLQQPPYRPWQPFEIELIQELTDQVGTAIAHAKLFNESSNIARELRKKSYAAAANQRRTYPQARRARRSPTPGRRSL